MSRFVLELRISRRRANIVFKAILLDIEGTTTPIDFVHKTLFPFAKKRVAKFVETHFDALRPEVEQLVDEGATDDTYTIPVDPLEPGSMSAYLEHLIEQDRKSTPLKSIQGKIWREGYESGELRSVVFEDVPRAFSRWQVAGKMIAIFSSGSVLAQQLLFCHTTHGDLTPFISNYFDTSTGPKLDAATYAKISTELALEASEILFCSDVLAEVDAARTSGLLTTLVLRPGNPPNSDDVSHRTISSFDELE